MFINYGDKNFFAHGRLVDAEHSDAEFRILYCEPYCDEDDMYLFADCTVNITDSWIDWDEVNSYAGLSETENEDKQQANIMRALAAIDYHGVENFSSPYDGYQFTEKEIKDRLKHYLIAHDNLIL